MPFTPLDKLGACRPRAAALRVAAATPPLSPLCAFRPQGRGALVRPPPAQPVQGFDTVSAFRGVAFGDVTASVKRGLLSSQVAGTIRVSLSPM
jgi:hypothetical protein